LAPLFTGKGIDYHMRGTHRAFLDRGGGLQRQQLLEQRFIQATAKQGE